jgi:hypothetical protein
MSRWLARLKNQKGPDPHPREPRQLPEVDSRGCSLGFQGYTPAPFRNFEGATAEPANDAAPAMADPDRACWPHSTAMNTREIDTFIARVARFTDRGLTMDEAERVADVLVQRDRDPGDDMRHCPECLHLQGRGLWRCGNYQRAGVGRDLPREIVIRAQRCPGFWAVPSLEAKEIR